MKTHQLKCPDCSKIRTYKSIEALNLATKIKSVCRNCSTIKYANKQSKLEVLLEDTPTTYYWIGFILADGHIDKRTRLKITLASKDEDHLLKLKEFLSIDNIIKTDINISISAMDVKILPLVSDKFNIESNKTYNPPNLNINNRQLLVSLIAGFIDGDGCIKKQSNKRLDFSLAVKCHKSWLNNLKLFCKTISGKDFCRINNQGYSIFNITDTKILKTFKEEVLKLNLPLMSRKWDVIDLNYKGKYEIANERLEKVKHYLSLGYNQTKIKNILGISSSGISLLIKRNKL